MQSQKRGHRETTIRAGQARKQTIGQKTKRWNVLHSKIGGHRAGGETWGKHGGRWRLAEAGAQVQRYGAEKYQWQTGVWDTVDVCEL